MAVLRVMAILQGPSADPKDRYVNTFHFDTGGAPEFGQASLDQIGSYLDEFYDVVDPHIPNAISRLAYRVYDLADALPRPVAFVDAIAQPTSASAPYPSEVAACLSFYGVRNLPRTRGRIFLGPLDIATSTVGETATDPQISAAFRTDVVTAAKALAENVYNSAILEGTRWVIYSPTSDDTVPIQNVWMNNSFDTIRSRGAAATLRTTAPVVGVPA